MSPDRDIYEDPWTLYEGPGKSEIRYAGILEALGKLGNIAIDLIQNIIGDGDKDDE